MAQSVANAKEFAEWSMNHRSQTCKMVGNGTEEMTKVAVWTNEDLEIPKGVSVANVSTADGTAKAVANWGSNGKTEKNGKVDGWNKLELELN